MVWFRGMFFGSHKLRRFGWSQFTGVKTIQKFNSSPLKRDHFKRKVVVQSLFFWGYIKFRRVYQMIYWLSRGVLGSVQCNF